MKLPEQARARNGRVRVAWTIAGFDPSSGAGVTADLKTFAAMAYFGCSAITALTVQSTRGVRAVEPVAPGLLAATLEELLDDLPPDVIKIGMLAGAEQVTVVAAFLRKLRAHAPAVPVVLDPVLRSSSGRALLSDDGVAALRSELLPVVAAVTPNWAELAVLTGLAVQGECSATAAGEALGARCPGLAVVATGGDQDKPVDRLRFPDGRWVSFAGERVETRSTHGTGCAFSSALACGLGDGLDLEAAVGEAKAFVTEALRRAPGLGRGKGPMALLWPLGGI